MAVSVPGNSCRPCTNVSATTGCPIRVSGACVYYSGSALAGPGINVADSLDTVINKLISFISAGPGTVTSVAASIPSGAIAISGSPITSSGTLAFTYTGTTAQYIRGDGSLATFPAIPVLGASQGLSLSGTNVVLGGTFSSARTISTTNGSTITISGNPNFGAILNVSSSGGFTGHAISATSSTGGGFAILANGGTTIGGGISIQQPSGNAGSALSITHFAPTGGILIQSRSTTATAVAMEIQTYQTGGTNTALVLSNQGVNTGGSALELRVGAAGTKVARVIGVRTDAAVSVGGALQFYTVNSQVEGLRGEFTDIGLGIGISSPSARLHLPSCTTTVPSILFTNGTLLTTPTNGAMEYDGTNLYFTTAGTRKIVQIGTTTGTIYNTDGSLTGARTVTMGGFPITWSDSGLFRITQGNVTIGATYDLNTGVDYLVYNATNSSNLVMTAAGGMIFQYTNLAGPTVVSSLGVNGTGVKLTGIQEFADNAAALSGGLTAGYLYRTADVLKIVH